jgi:hypothetical protein
LVIGKGVNGPTRSKICVAKIFGNTSAPQTLQSLRDLCDSNF